MVPDSLVKLSLTHFSMFTAKYAMQTLKRVFVPSECKHMITEEQIECGKKEVNYSLNEPPFHEHHDCVRIAYAWFDAQAKLGNSTKRTPSLKHIIEKWAGRYVSTADVELAAHLHPEIHGRYPRFNISTRLTLPSGSRLKDISEAFTQVRRYRIDPSIYSAHE